MRFFSLARVFVFLLLFILADVSVVAVEKSGVDVAPMGQLLLQDAGRKKPFDTFSRESLVTLTGRARWKDASGEKWSALEILTDFALETNNWLNEKLIKIGYIPLKNELKLPAGETFFSYQQLRNNTPAMQSLHQLLLGSKDDNSGDKKLRTEASLLQQKLRLIEKLTLPDTFSWVPVSGGMAWETVAEGAKSYPAQTDKLTASYAHIVSAYQQGANDDFRSSVVDFSTQLQTLVAPNIYPVSKARTEVFYNHLHPFRFAWILLLFSFLVSLRSIRGSWMYWGAICLFSLSLVLQFAGFTLRTLISGRAPVTNMYEVLVFMSLGACLLAIFYEIVGKFVVRQNASTAVNSPVFLISASALGTLTLILADNLPTVFDPSIQPLVPVLQSNWWLTVHVITISIGYAAFLLSMGLGHIALWQYLFHPSANETISSLTRANYRVLQIGVLFLAAGTLLGGLWAEKAWGRFWGWDPKETWALIALLLYLGVLHARYTNWIGGFGLNVASVLAFQGIVMAGYGVNYILGTGKHSYGFGVGGEIYVGIFVLIEVVLVLLAVIRSRSRTRENKKSLE